MKSKFEENVISDLTSRAKAFTYEALKLPYKLKGYYIPDLVLSSGVIVELKGYFRKDAQTKMRAVKEANPELDIRFIFMKASARLQGAQKRKDGTYMTCAEYAQKYGFIYAEHTIPEEWFT